MTPTKDQQAQEYAKQIQKDFIHNRLVTEELAFEDIEAAWLDGYTACEQSMWRSVEEELPSNDADILVSDGNGLHIASYFNGDGTRPMTNLHDSRKCGCRYPRSPTQIPRTMENNQPPSECKHCKINIVGCFNEYWCMNSRHQESFCSYRRQQGHCPDYEPKEKKDARADNR